MTGGTGPARTSGPTDVATAFPRVAAPVAPVVACLGGCRVLYLVAVVIGLVGALPVGRIGGVRRCAGRPVSPPGRVFERRVHRLGEKSYGSTGPASYS